MSLSPIAAAFAFEALKMAIEEKEHLGAYFLNSKQIQS
jgi:hypothetical protein